MIRAPACGISDQPDSVSCQIVGQISLTGFCHSEQRAALMFRPTRLDPRVGQQRFADIKAEATLPGGSLHLVKLGAAGISPADLAALCGEPGIPLPLRTSR